MKKRLFMQTAAALALIGSALMTTENPVALLKSMIAAGRGARR